MGRGANMGDQDPEAARRLRKMQLLYPEPFFIHFLRTFKEVLKFVLFSYTCLFGSLLLARWTTYFVVGK